MLDDSQASRRPAADTCVGPLPYPPPNVAWRWSVESRPQVNTGLLHLSDDLTSAPSANISWWSASCLPWGSSPSPR